jgi:hypothetical protein
VIEFRDKDLLDVWDDDDPIEVRMNVLRRAIAAALLLRHVPPEYRDELLRLVIKLEQARDMLGDHLEHLHREIRDL